VYTEDVESSLLRSISQLFSLKKDYSMTSHFYIALLLSEVAIKQLFLNTVGIIISIKKTGIFGRANKT